MESGKRKAERGSRHTTVGLLQNISPVAIYSGELPQRKNMHGKEKRKPLTKATITHCKQELLLEGEKDKREKNTREDILKSYLQIEKLTHIRDFFPVFFVPSR
jgi:hypothetical protein